MRICGLFLAAAPLLAQGLTEQRIVKALDEQQNWLTYFGDYSGRRHRDLKQIHTGNVAQLRPEWIFQTGQAGEFQATPLVVDGIMYFTSANAVAFAIDAKTGRQLWKYSYPLPKGELLPNGSVNRGFAMLGDRLFMTTPDAHVVALDARTGDLLWDTEMADNKAGYGATMAPLVVKDKVIVGVGGGEFGIRGFIDAYDVRTGKRAWRFDTVPSPQQFGGDTWSGDSWKRGGGPAWMTGTYDPELNLIYWGVGNPGPDLYGAVRKGDNLFTCSVVALNPDTGERKWHFQFTPHDTHDWDANETPMLIDAEWRGKPRKLLVQANRNAFYYVLDRVTGEFLLAKPFARQTWAREIDDRGRPVVLPNTEPSKEGTRVCPGLAGATNWMPPALNAQTGWFYFTVREQCDVFYEAPPTYIQGKAYWGSVFRGVTDEKEYGLIVAMDPLTAEKKWEFKLNKAAWSGVLSTAGGLIFATDLDGYMIALDARTGAALWRFNLGATLKGAPITYLVDGRQYVTMGAGSAVIAFALPK